MSTGFNGLLGSYQHREAYLNLAALCFPETNLSCLEIFDLHPEKAPRPDGYTGLFFRKCRDLIKNGLVGAVLHFQNLITQNIFLLNSAIIALLPKHQGANKPNEFRPISLLHCFAKIIAKILASRLQPFMHRLTSQCQNAFSKGQSIHDNFVYVQEMAKSFIQKEVPAVMIKLDLSKAFDSVAWEFLLKLLQFRGFGSISAMFLSASTKVLVNSQVTDQILHRKGLKQGDPFLPSLFVLVA